MNDGDYPPPILAPLIELFIKFDFVDGVSLHMPGHGEGQNEGVFLQCEPTGLSSVAA